MIYDFKFLESFLQNRNIIILGEGMSIDLDQSMETLMNVVSFDKNGLFAIDPISQKRYDFYYYKNPYSFQNGSRPKFHIQECEAVRQFGGYKISYKKRVKVRNTRTNEILELELELCRFCNNMVLSGFQTTAHFFEIQKAKWEENQKYWGDYTADWDTVSKRYRTSVQYVCEDCGIDLSRDKEYCETHHIDGNKCHNTTDNLKSLCVLCHANQNDRHRMNFKARRNKNRLIDFILKHKQSLISKNNLWVGEYLELYKLELKRKTIL